MKPARVLFVAEAVTVTHIGRLLKLARGLDPARFTPLLAWHPRFNRVLGSLPGEFFPTFSIPSTEFLEKLYQARPVYDFHTLERYIAWDLEVMRETRPDVVVGDYRLSLPISTRFAGVPFINIINAHWSPFARPEYRVPESPITHLLPPAAVEPFFRLLRPLFFRLYAEDFNRLDEKFGRPGFGPDLRKIYCFGDRVLYPDLAEVVPAGELPPTHRFIGPVVWSPDLPLPAGAEARIPGRKTVYVNLGTSGNASLLPRVVEALSRRGLRVIAATGREDVRLPAMPGVVAAQFVSGDAACRAADLAVYNGGSAGGHQAMLAGIPVLGIPSNLDQFLNMHFVEKAGLGLMLRPERLTASRLAAAADRLLTDPGFTARAGEMAKKAAAYRPVQALEETIADMMEGRAPRPAPPSAPAPEGPHPPSAAVAREIVAAAVRAPSVGNSQPFRYVWDGKRLGVHLLPDRANPFLNFQNPDTWLCLGAVLANLRVAAAARGYRTEVRRILEGGADGLGAWVLFTPGKAPEAALAPFIEGRCTNRRAHDGKPVPADLLATMTAEADCFPRVRMGWFTSPEHVGRLATAFAIFNRVLFENHGLLSSFLRWLRFARAADVQDGLALDTLEVPGRGWALRIAASTWRAALLAKLGFFRMFAGSTGRTLKRSGAFGYITIDRNDMDAVVDAGEAMEMVWLRSVELGLAFQPLAGILILVNRVKHFGGAGLGPAQRRLAAQATAILEEFMPDLDRRLPAIFFRVGYAPPPTARSGRRPLEDVLEIRDAR